MSAARSARDDRHRGRMAALQLLYQREVGGAVGAELDEAVRLREEAQELLATSQRQKRESAHEAQRLLEQAAKEAERATKDAEGRLVEQLARREQLAKEKIAQAEAEALLQVRHATAEIAVEATRRLLAERMDAAASRALVDDAIRELPDKLH